MNSQWPGPGNPWGDRTASPPPHHPGSGPPGVPGFSWHASPPPGFPPPPPAGEPSFPGPPLAKGNAVLALIIAIILTLTCVGITDVIGIVLAAVALSKDEDPEEFDRYVPLGMVGEQLHPPRLPHPAARAVHHAQHGLSPPRRDAQAGAARA